MRTGTKIFLIILSLLVIFLIAYYFDEITKILNTEITRAITNETHLVHSGYRRSVSDTFLS